MNNTTLYKQLSNTTIQRNILLATTGLLLISNIVLGTYINFQDSKIVVIPSQVTKAFEVSTKGVSTEYIELMARDVVQSLLTLTADNIDYFGEVLLKIAHPKFHGELKQQMSELEEDVKKREVRIHFSISEIETDKTNLLAEVNGYLDTYVGLRKTSTELKKYIVGFDYTGGRLMLTKFYEVEEEKNDKQDQ